MTDIDRELERLNDEITKRVPPQVWSYINAYVVNRKLALLSRIKEEVVGSNEDKINEESLSDHHRRSARNQMRKRMRRNIDNIAKKIKE